MTHIIIGKKYQIIDWTVRPEHWSTSGDMDCWRGKTVTIDAFLVRGYLRICEDYRWCWRSSDFVLIDNTPKIYKVARFCMGEIK